jgi:hypothetical protein
MTTLVPWWQIEPLQAAQARDHGDDSPVLSAADAWFDALGIDAPVAVDSDYAVVSPDEINEMDLAADGLTIVDANEVNAMDLAADDNDGGAPQSKSWLNILLASLGGALAVVSTARFLFV